MKSYPIIYQDFSIVGLKKQWEYQQKLGGLIRNSDASDSEGNIYVRGRIVDKPSAIGCKTETRRLTGLKEINKNPDRWKFFDFSGGEAMFLDEQNFPADDFELIKCPYGSVGDELWVKEKWGVGCRPHQINGWVDGIEYAADQLLIDDGDDLPLYESDIDISKYNQGWKSPLFMPKAASRITLEITGVSVERLQDITEEGALREGVTEKWNEIITFPKLDNKQIKTETYAAGYAKKWAELHGKESWNLNPWVWVIQFKVKEFKQ